MLALLLLLTVEFNGRVVGVVDGDTINVLHRGKAERIRLYGIDAPERRQPFGSKSRGYLGELVSKQTVRVVVRTHDRYKRPVADVYLGKMYINQEMVRAGMAWWYRRYAPRDTLLRDTEEKARETGLGLWADTDATAPWNYRKPSPRPPPRR